MYREFKRRFWMPPRAHGDVIEDRTVSFLELFYDLVYVVVIARAAHHLAEHVTWRGVGEFAVVFGLIWLAWLNGTMMYELHGREDGRTRTYVFLQMLLLALLAVFTGDAVGEGGRSFALTYAAYMAVLSWLWYTVQRQDTAEYLPMTRRYLAGMVVTVLVVTTSAFLADEVRLLVWAVIVLSWIVGSSYLARRSELTVELGMTSTDSMVERFGLFTIIVLGEVVVGVVEGLSGTDRSFLTISTGLLGLMIGFAFWWTYFDFVGRRLPGARSLVLMRWMLGHLPVSMAIAASGAAMVSLIEHAGDAAAPSSTAWLLTGSVAAGLLGLVVIMRTLEDHDRFPSIYRPVTRSLVVAACLAAIAGWAHPAPWLLALLLVLLLGAVWWLAVDRWLRLVDPEEALPG